LQESWGPTYLVKSRLWLEDGLDFSCIVADARPTGAFLGQGREKPYNSDMSLKRLAFLLVILFFLLTSSAPFSANSFYGVAQPYVFSLARWEVVSLAHKAADLVHRPPEDIELVEGYFAGAGGEEGEVEAILEGQLRRVLKEEGINPFPPPLADFDTPPHILVISPRDRIELTKSIILRQVVDTGEMETLEAAVTALGYSGLVDDIGGLSTYPSFIMRGIGLDNTVENVAHEWLHLYFFFRPLGRAYAKSYEMTTINETAADIGGKELASRILPIYGRELNLQPGEPSPLDQRLREIRLQVDDLLAQGEVDRAETYMEEERQALAGEGYNIRKLNQAYFAFHGTYADVPGSTSPVGDELRLLRQQSSSLGDFLRQVSSITSYDELKALVSSGP
jgi:hypothetical protein